MRRLLGIIRRSQTAPGDLSYGDWTPPPPSSQGQRDLAAWLQEAEPTPRVAPPATSWVEVLKAFGEHLTDAELRIIRQQLAGS